MANPESTDPQRRWSRLAARLGVGLSYTDLEGATQTVPRETVRSLIQALGVDADSDAQVAEVLDGPPDGGAVVPPVRVMTRSSVLSQELEVELGETSAVEVRWSLELQTEQGQRSSQYGTQALAEGEPRFQLPYPPAPPIGYHEIAITVETGNRRWFGEQRWIVVPDGCAPVSQPLDGHRAFGLTVQLYAVRSTRNWGFGDFTDLGRICRRLATHGADFVALSPLHATTNRWPDISPYSPASRLFISPLYIDVEALPELALSEQTRMWLTSEVVQETRDTLRAADQIDYDAVATLKLRALRRLHRVFVKEHRDADTTRGQAYRQFRREQGSLLEAFAVYQAMDELMFATEGCTVWRDWPEVFHDPTSAAVRDFAETHAALVDFHRFLQFEADRQLADAADIARQAGMRIGLVLDLAVGSGYGSFDTWAFPELFARGVDLGAPGDPFAPAGQNWGLTPLDHRQLRNEGYGLWSRLLRNAFRHAGGLRIDHILGLVRQFWIPSGTPAADGTYVHPPSFDLFGILALESQRAGVIVIGEDLGTIPEGMAQAMERWRVLSTRVLYFERDSQGGFLPANEVASHALLSPNTHDLAPLAAWWSGSDIDLRADLGLLSEDQAAAQHWQREQDREQLRQRLTDEGLLDSTATEVAYPELAGGVFSLLARSAAALVSVSLDDLLAETEPINLPGVAPDRYRSWCRRHRRPFGTALDEPSIIAMLDAARR